MLCWFITSSAWKHRENRRTTGARTVKGNHALLECPRYAHSFLEVVTYPWYWWTDDELYRRPPEYTGNTPTYHYTVRFSPSIDKPTQPFLIATSHSALISGIRFPIFTAILVALWSVGRFAYGRQKSDSGQSKKVSPSNPVIYINFYWLISYPLM